MLVLLASVALVGLALDPPGEAERGRLVPDGDGPASLVEAAVTYSSVVRGLVKTIEYAGVDVSLGCSARLPPGTGQTIFGAHAGRVRIAITLNAHDLLIAGVPMLAHELQHAAEIIDGAPVHQSDVRRVFVARGTRRGKQFETAAAQFVGRAVARELEIYRHLLNRQYC